MAPELVAAIMKVSPVAVPAPASVGCVRVDCGGRRRAGWLVGGIVCRAAGNGKDEGRRNVTACPHYAFDIRD